MRVKPIALGRSKYTVHFRDDTDESVIYEVLQAQDYRACEQIIRQAGSAIIDIGAHIGTFELYVRALNAEVPVFAYEPLVSNYEVLKENLHKNHLKNIFSSQQAVAGAVGEVLLHLSNNNHNNSLEAPYSEATEQTQKVQATTLDRILQKHRLEKCDLLKIDCEGAEYAIFENTAAETFAKIGAIFMEYHEHFGRSHKELITLLQQHGFRVKAHHPSKYSKELGTLFLTK